MDLRIEVSQDLSANILYLSCISQIYSISRFLIHGFSEGGTTTCKLVTTFPSRIRSTLRGNPSRNSSPTTTPRHPRRKGKTCIRVSFLLNRQHAAFTIPAAFTGVPGIDFSTPDRSLHFLRPRPKFRLNFNHREQFCSIN